MHIHTHMKSLKAKSSSVHMGPHMSITHVGRPDFPKKNPIGVFKEGK